MSSQPAMSVGKNVSVTLRAVTLAVAAVTIVIIALLRAADVEIADKLYGDHPMEGLKGALDLTLASYAELIKLTTLSFGGVAFLVSYQQKNGRHVSSSAWASLAVSMVFLIGAFLLALAGRERIVLMIAQNAVDLSLDFLAYARWVMYALTVIGLAFLGWFALHVTVAADE
jgi:hypothetical protein